MVYKTVIVDGKKIAQEVLAGLGNSMRGLTIGLVMDHNDAASDSFVKMKERVAERLGVEIKRFNPEEIHRAVLCDGVIVQLPIENADALLAQIPPKKDVDALGKNSLVRAPVAEAVKEILSTYEVETYQKKAVVMGKGRLVGAPVAKLLRELGAEVKVVSLESGSLEELKSADIVVSGAGSPHLIKPEMLKPGVVLIDAGTSEAAGKLAGDADPACAQVASVFTPTPGGVGPIAVAMLFRNLSTLAHKGDF